jgi:hypothetical protein
MKLKEWAALKSLYKISRQQPKKLLFKGKKVFGVWSVCFAVFITIVLLAFVLSGLKYPVVLPYAYMALGPWAVLLYAARIKLLRSVFPKQFAEHAIDLQSWREKENILCYSFFLELAREKGYTAAKLRALSAYSDLTVAPAKPALSQNLGFASLLGLMMGLSAEVIKNTQFFLWGKGAVALILIAASLFIYWLVWDGFQTARYERLCIKRYVDLAAYDLEDVVKESRPSSLTPEPVHSLSRSTMSKQTEPTA